jgi:DNA-binding LacI/PurR family transcriptional regulator
MALTFSGRDLILSNSILWYLMRNMKNSDLKKDVLYEQLKKDILSGKFPAEMKLPRELDFAKQLGVAKVTLRSALSRLEENGLIARIHGKGTFIKKEDAPRGILVVSKDMNRFANPSAHVLEGVKNSATENSYSLTVAEMDYLGGLSGKELRVYAEENGISGIIILSGYFLGHEKIIKTIKDSGLPAVIASAHENDSKTTGFASIVVDRKSAWEEAIKYLCQKGHSRIVTVIHDGPLKIRGYTEDEHLALLGKYGASTDKNMLLYSEEYERNSVKEGVKKLMKASDRPTAVLCYSDYYAIYVYEALKEMGLIIPDDVAVMGYCGYPGATLLSPALSTMDYEYSKIGNMSFQLLSRSSEWFKEGVAVPVIPKKAMLRERKSAGIKRFEKEMSNAF